MTSLFWLGEHGTLWCFYRENSKESVPGVRLYISLNPGLAQEPTWYEVICGDLISLLCCFCYTGFLVKQSLSYLASLNVLVLKKTERLSLSTVWSDTNDQQTACPEEQNWLFLITCAGKSLKFMNSFEGSNRVPCSQKYQVVLSWHPNCLLLQILLKLAIFTSIIICLNIANEFCNAYELSAVHVQSNQLKPWGVFSALRQDQGRPCCCLELPNRKLSGRWSQTLLRGAQIQRCLGQKSADTNWNIGDSD